MLPSSRLLPATIVAIAVVLTLKAVDLASTLPGFGALRSETAQALLQAGSSAGSMIAQAHAEQPAAPARPAPPATPPRTASTAQPVPPLPAPPAPPAHAMPEKPEPEAPVASIAPAAPVTPAAPTPDALGSVEALKARRSQIEERERQLGQREAAVAATEKRLTERVAELVGLQTRLQELENGLKERDQANWSGMVRVYEGMKPRDAAAIFNALDKPVLLEVLDRMKPAKAAPVIAAMETEKARQVTADLAAKRTRTTTIN